MGRILTAKPGLDSRQIFDPMGGVMRRLVAGCLVVGALILSTPAVFADTPEPIPGKPGCVGQVVAVTNHASGSGGPSGNPRASAGPGVFLGPDTAEAVHDAQAFCRSQQP
jgi:hypothetical protein